MIKKISTLLAAVALLGTTSVFAQSGYNPIGSSVDVTTGLQDQGLYTQFGATNVTSLKLGSNAGYFQLAIEGSPTEVLALTPTGKLVIEDLSAPSVPFANTMWCVSIAQQDQSQTPKYDFLNKGASRMLDITMSPDLVALLPNTASSDSIEVGGEIGGWSLSAQYLSQLQAGTMYSSFKADSVIGFYVDASNTVTLKKIGFNAAVADNINNGGIYTKFRLQRAAMIVLTADQINTYGGNEPNNTSGVTLSFDPNVDAEGNPFTDQKFKAEAIAGSDYVRITRAAANNTTQYLRVDTSYINTEGIKFLDYAWTNTVAASLALQYNFHFTYSPSDDELFIQVEQVTVKADDDAFFTTNPKTIINSYVSLQNLTGNKLLTVGNRQNTVISFGLGDCKAAPTNRSSLPNDLYVITDGNGKYLAVPIYEEVKGNFNATWVTIEDIDKMDPWNMPAFQWVVEKTLSYTESLKPTSPVTITNREFASVQFQNVQFYNDGTRTTLTPGYINGNTNPSLTTANFIADPANVKRNPYVGYRKFDEDSVKVISYTFKYLNDLASTTSYYLSQLAGDSVMTVSTNAMTFAIEEDLFEIVRSNGTAVYPTLRDTLYGYYTDSVANLAKLQRKAYRLREKNSGKYLMIDREGRYALSSYVSNAAPTVNNPVGIFYLKENNYTDGTHYYALVDVNNKNTTTTASQLTQLGEETNYLKASVKEASLRITAEKLSEERTSAFAIGFDETPLYRRFNTTLEVEVEEGEENAKAVGEVVGDSTVYLQFYMTYRNEYLQVENNRGAGATGIVVPGIDFAGLWTADAAGSGLSFRVDTAWVGRGLGYIKPQYLISIQRNDFVGQDAEACPIDHHDGTGYDKWTCPHAKKAIPAFRRGKYLVNTKVLQSRAVKWNEKTDNQLKWRTYYDRAAFVDAIQLGDTLFIPKKLNSYYELPNDQVDVTKLRKLADSKPLTNTNYTQDVDTDDYIIVYLVNDNHKYATWSMRFVDPEAAAVGEKEFLIESMNAVVNNNIVTSIGNGEIIAPNTAQWMKMQNGVLTLSDPKESRFSDMTGQTSGDDALIFDVKKGNSETDKPLDNTEVEASAVTVIAETGAVVIKNAAGKKVAISNILGQTVANTVITSDNATIAVPQGVVVVAVEGEAAVKAIVK